MLGMTHGSQQRQGPVVTSRTMKTIMPVWFRPAKTALLSLAMLELTFRVGVMVRVRKRVSYYNGSDRACKEFPAVFGEFLARRVSSTRAGNLCRASRGRRRPSK